MNPLYESAMNAPIQQEQHEPGIHQEETLGAFGWACIAAVIFVTGGCIAYCIDSLWPSVVAAWSGL